MAGSLDVDKRPVVSSGGKLYSSASMNTNKCGGHESPDVFCGLASLIVEGRVPRTDVGKDSRGVHHEEGPHALKHYGPSGNLLHGHVCSADNYMCKKDENFRKHMLLLWQNNVPVSIEVLLCSDCRVGKQKANSVEYSTIPEPGSILLEQWTVSISNNFKRKDHTSNITGNTTPSSNADQNKITARGLFQAVRSYLHFSQLSAWYESFCGTSPSSVLYRITIPGETFASKFSCQPEQHYFPPAAVGSMALVNVAVRSYPRTDKIPNVICPHNTAEIRSHFPVNSSYSSTGDLPPSDSSSPSVSPTCGNKANIDQTNDSKPLTAPNNNTEDNKLAIAGALSWKETERLETDLRRMTLVKNKMTECTLSHTNISNAALPRSDSMDSMLGDSLLDPPQDLQKMPPKRYQSPSRCGSPSIEAPEHLLFRSHYNSNENALAASQLYKTKGDDARNSESARNRLARQDLLRRRDIGQTLGISGPCHGLHPRMLLNVGQHQPRLSLPPKANATIMSPVISTNGPYRAFPPERGMHQFTQYVERSSSNNAVTPKYCGISEDLSHLTQQLDKMQVKCNISGKHICKHETQNEEHKRCCNLGNQCTDDSISRDKIVHDLEKCTNGDKTKKEKDDILEEVIKSSSDTICPLTESTPSFILGGAKKKSALPLNRVHKKNSKTRSPNSKRGHYKQIESDDDTGMEVAEYDIDITNTTQLKNRQKSYEAVNEHNNKSEDRFQKELNEILDGLAPKKEICTSRRSSLKDEDQLFPHKCKCVSGLAQAKRDGMLDQAIPKTPMFKHPPITQVYRAKTETPPLVSSPLLHAKTTNNNRSNSPSQALNKADILLGAILRTCERNKHLENEDDLTTGSSSSSREDSYTVGVIRKSPDGRKNSGGDADDEEEDEGNTSSDNGSSILSSPTSSDEEDTHFAQHDKPSNIHWYKQRTRGVQIPSRQKRNAQTTKVHTLSDSSSSQCSSTYFAPSINSSAVLPPNSTEQLYTEKTPPNDYAKTQNFCDTEDLGLNSQQVSVREKKQEITSYEKSNSSKIINDGNRSSESNKCKTIIELDKNSYSHRLPSESVNANPENINFALSNMDSNSPDNSNDYEDQSSDFDSATCNCVQPNYHPNLKNQVGSDVNRCTECSDLKNCTSNCHCENTGVRIDRLRTMPEDFDSISPETTLDDHDHITSGMLNQRKNSDSNFIKLEPFDTDTWFDDNYGKDYATIPDGYQVQNQTNFSNDGKNKQSKNISSSKDELLNGVATNLHNGISIPTMVQKDYFRKTLNSATSMVYHRNTGLPLSSSPAPHRRGDRKDDFGYDSSINTPRAIKRALYPTPSPRGGCPNTMKSKNHTQNLEVHSSDKEEGSQDMDDIGTEEMEDYELNRALLHVKKKKRQNTVTNDEELFSTKKHRSCKGMKVLSTSAPAYVSSQGTTANHLLGTFEESALNGRLEPVSTVEGFNAEIGASGSFHPKHKTVPVTVFFYNMCCDNSPNISSPYLGHINLGKKGYRIPQSGTIQVTLFNPLGTVVKMFVVMYDLNDMPPNSQTFIRQRTFYMPTSDSNSENDGATIATSQDGRFPVGASPKWLRYLIHLRFASSKSGKIYLHTDVRMIVFRKSDLDTAAEHNITPGKLGGFELRSFTNGPTNPKFSPRKINFRQEE